MRNLPEMKNAEKLLVQAEDIRDRHNLQFVSKDKCVKFTLVCNSVTAGHVAESRMT